MVFTRGLIRSINAAIRRVCGGRREWSIGIFGAGDFDDGGNLLVSWIWETRSHQEIGLLMDEPPAEGGYIPEVEGVVILDCYCRYPDDDEDNGGLDQNVYVCITEGKVTHASNSCDFMISGNGNWAVDLGSTSRYLSHR